MPVIFWREELVLRSPEGTVKARRALDFHSNSGLIESLSCKRAYFPCGAEIHDNVLQLLQRKQGGKWRETLVRKKVPLADYSNSLKISLYLYLSIYFCGKNSWKEYDKAKLSQATVF